MEDKRLDKLIEIQKQAEEGLKKLEEEKEKNKRDAKILKEVEIEESAKKIELKKLNEEIEEVKENNDAIEKNKKEIQKLEDEKEKLSKARETLLADKESYLNEEPKDKSGYIYIEWTRDIQKIEDEIQNIEKLLKGKDSDIKTRNSSINEKQNETEVIFLKYHIRDEEENVKENISKELETQEDKEVEEQAVQEEHTSNEQKILHNLEKDEAKDDWEYVGNNLYNGTIKESEIEKSEIKSEYKSINEKIKDLQKDMDICVGIKKRLEKELKEADNDVKKAMIQIKIDEIEEKYNKKSDEIGRLLKNQSKIEKEEDSSKQKESEEIVYATNSKQKDKKIKQTGSISEEIKVGDKVIKVPYTDISNKSELNKLEEFNAYLDDNGWITYDMNFMDGKKYISRTEITMSDYKKRLKQIAKEYKVKIWDRKYLKNIDPYLIDSLEQIGEKDLANSLVQEAISLKEKEQADVILKGTYDMAKMNYVKRENRNVIRKIARGAKKIGMDIENYKESLSRRLWEKIKSGFVKTFGKPEEQKYFPKSYSYKVHTEKKEKTPLQKSADGYNLVKFSDFKDRINAPDEVKKAISHKIQEIKKSDKSNTKDNEKESVK